MLSREMSPAESTSHRPRADNPIKHPEEDALGRVTAAVHFARQILELDATEGTVVGVLGPWGSGKTSFINLARPEFERAGVPVLDFNPWMFSGTQQLVESFFVELSAQLKLRADLGELGENLADYGEAFSGLGWLPLVGSWVERVRVAATIIGTVSKHRKQGIAGRRTKIEKTLASLGKPILIVLDDIDRLTSSEIREIFRLVRLTASFPNLIYIVAFDRARVEDALAEQGVPGRDYLEKILQLAIDLPRVPQSVLVQQVASALDAALAGIEKTGPFQEEVWPDVFAEIVLPLIRNMRDVRRYVAAIKGTVTALDGQVAVADVLGLEAIRVFLPDVFAKLHDAVGALTATAGVAWGSRRDSPGLKKQVDDLLVAGQAHADVARAMIERLFPAALRHIGNTSYTDDWKATWLREHRLAHEDILRFYLERVAGEGLRSFTDAERAFALFGDRDYLERYLRSLEPNRLQFVITYLETYQDQFKPEHAVLVTIVLLNLLPEIPERQRQILELNSRFTVTRVVLRLLRPLKDPDNVEAAVREILPHLTSLSSKQELITLVGHRKNSGHKLVSESAATQFEKLLRSDVRTAPVEQLIRERDVGALLFVAKREAEPGEGELTIPSSPQLALALLKTARKEVLRQAFGSRTLRRTPCLDWDGLVQLYGDEATLRQRIEELKAAHPEDVGDLLDLASRYLSGWRPSRLDDED